MKKGLIYISLFIFTSSCAPFVDSPFSDALLRPERNLNQLSVSKLGDIEADGKITLAVFSDSHQNYKQTDKVSFAINRTPNVDFIAGLGDYTNSAYNLEYDQFIDSIGLMMYPRILAIGNHDAIGAGPELFKKAFGEANFFFESTSFRYIYFNSCNLEDPAAFKPQWLLDRVNESTKPVIIFSHVQLRDTERYFGNDATILGQVITHPNTKIIFNGHNHVYNFSLDNNTIMMQSGRVDGEEGPHWLLVEITPGSPGQFCVTRMDKMENTCQNLKP